MNYSSVACQINLDQRFFRRQYDAARTLAAFATSAREGADPEDWAALGVVDDTMQPASVRLWLEPAVAGRQPAGPAQEGEG